MYVFQPHVFLSIIYQLMMVRLGHVSISIQYDSMFAFIHLFCMHKARRIILTAFVFQFQIEYKFSCSIPYAMFRIAEPAIVCILACVALGISVYLGSCMISYVVSILAWSTR